MKAIHEGWITRNKEVMMGKPCIKGTRITVELVLERLSEGESIDEFLKGYEHVTREAILACMDYARAIISHDEIFELAE